MLFVFAVLYLFRHFSPGAHSLPTSTPTTVPQLTHPSILYARQDSPDLASSKACPHMRSVWDIVLNCLSTTFISTWVAVHPNVPSQDASPWFLRRRRIKLMVWALFTPELYVWWAFKQRMSAKTVTRKLQGTRSLSAYLNGSRTINSRQDWQVSRVDDEAQLLPRDGGLSISREDRCLDDNR